MTAETFTFIFSPHKLPVKINISLPPVQNHILKSVSRAKHEINLVKLQIVFRNKKMSERLACDAIYKKNFQSCVQKALSEDRLHLREFQ